MTLIECLHFVREGGRKNEKGEYIFELTACTWHGVHACVYAKRE